MTEELHFVPRRSIILFRSLYLFFSRKSAESSIISEIRWSDVSDGLINVFHGKRNVQISTGTDRTGYSSRLLVFPRYIHFLKIHYNLMFRFGSSNILLIEVVRSIFEDTRFSSIRLLKTIHVITVRRSEQCSVVIFKGSFLIFEFRTCSNTFDLSFRHSRVKQWYRS